MSYREKHLLNLGVRCKLAGEYAEPGRGPYFGETDWDNEDNARHRAQTLLASGRYKVVELITQHRRNGRWQHHSRTPVSGPAPHQP